MSKLLGIVEVDGVEFECYGEFDKPDPTVGYNGCVYIEDVKFNNKSFLDILKTDVINYMEDELHYELT